MNTSLLNAADLLRVAHDSVVGMPAFDDVKIYAPDFSDDDYAAYSEVWGSLAVSKPVRQDDSAFDRAIEWASALELYAKAMQTALRYPSH